jgi:transposase-like protein
MSFRAVEELLFERGVLLSYETVRRCYLSVLLPLGYRFDDPFLKVE